MREMSQLKWIFKSGERERERERDRECWNPLSTYSDHLPLLVYQTGFLFQLPFVLHCVPMQYRMQLMRCVVMNIRTVVFWDVRPCRLIYYLVSEKHNTKRDNFLSLTYFNAADESIIFLRNFHKFLTHYMPPYHRRKIYYFKCFVN
jgi:hypothetical protein